MKPGDLVRWIGFPGASSPKGVLAKGKGVGIIVSRNRIGGSERFDVSWHDGQIGTNIYPQCLEVLS